MASRGRLSDQEWKELEAEANEVWGGLIGNVIGFEQYLPDRKTDPSAPHFYDILNRGGRFMRVHQLLCKLLGIIANNFGKRQRRNEFFSLVRIIALKQDIPLAQRCSLLREFASAAGNTEKHMVYRELWNLGLGTTGFEELCAATLMPKPLPMYEVAKRLFGDDCNITNASGRQAATQRLRYYLGFKTTTKGQMPFTIKGAAKPATREGRNKIRIPLIYFPDKSEHEKQICREAKIKISGHDLREEPMKSTSLQLEKTT